MPKFAFALPLRPGSQEDWRHAAHELLTERAKDHRASLLDRGIFRERVWLQHGHDCPLATMVLWDCDDVTRATTMGPTGNSDAHARWLTRTFLAGFHGQDPAGFALPRPEVLSGRTVRPTGASNAQTMFAIPVPDGGLPALRGLMARAEGGDLDEAHRRLLLDSGVHEEWTWVQPASPGLPQLLLLYWIGEDLVLAWKRMMTAEDNPYLQAFLTILSNRRPEERAVELDWQVEQVMAMHVRRSDGGDERVRRLATRLGSALSRGRWDLVADALSPDATVLGAPTQARGSADVLQVVRQQLGDGDLVVTDTLVSDTQIIATIGDQDLAVLFGLDSGAVTSVRLLGGHS